jgi:hypothetical protein
MACQEQQYMDMSHYEWQFVIPEILQGLSGIQLIQAFMDTG